MWILGGHEHPDHNYGGEDCDKYGCVLLLPRDGIYCKREKHPNIYGGDGGDINCTENIIRRVSPFFFFKGPFLFVKKELPHEANYNSELCARK